MYQRFDTPFPLGAYFIWKAPYANCHVCVTFFKVSISKCFKQWAYVVSTSVLQCKLGLNNPSVSAPGGSSREL